MTGRGLLFALLAAATLLPGPRVTAERADYLGRTIGEIRLAPDGEVPEQELRARLRVQAGRPLDLDDVAASIRSLYASGLFRTVRVDAELNETGTVDLIFVLSLHFIVETVDFDGIPVDERSAAAQLVRVRVGNVASLDAIDRGAEELQQYLVRRGYMTAVVDPAVSFRRAPHRAAVTYFIDAGTPARVSAIRFDGETAPFSEAELAAMLEKRVGREFSASLARRWAENLTDALVRQDYRDASVRFEDAVLDPTSNTVELVFEIEVGPRLTVEIEGSDERGVKRLIPFKKKEPYSDDKLQETLDAIEEWYQKRGYLFASARATDATTEGVRTLTITVRPGEAWKLGDVVFSGSEQIDDDRISDVIATGKPNLLQRIAAAVLRSRQGVTYSQLDEDRAAIESLYRTNGFLTAIVDRGRAETREDEQVIDVVFEIYEGPQTIVSDVEISGLLAMDRTSLPDLASRAGKPANPVAITSDLLALRTALAGSGFAEATVRHELVLSEDSTTAKLTYHVDEGDRFRYGSLSIQGNSYTADSVILNKSRTLRTGKPYSFADITRVQRDLYQLGIFRKVAINSVESPEDPLTRDLRVDIEEGQAVRVTGSVGYSTDEKVRLRGSVAHRNLFGKARYLGLDALYSDVIERYFLTYREPFTFGRDIATQFTIFQDDEIQDEIILDRYGLYVEMSRLIRDNLRYSIRYDYKVVTPSCPNLSDEECDRLFFGVQTEKQDDTIASISQNLFWDQRDDAINPTKGYLARGSIEYAFPQFKSEAEFVKGFTQVSWFRPVGRRAVVALSGRLGLIYPISEGDPYNAVPFSERFLAGGENSHRGFRLKKMGILGDFNDADFSVTPPGATVRSDVLDGEVIYSVLGGNAMFILNAEYRYAITDSVGVTAFLDIGQIWRMIDTVDLGYLKYAPGLGVYYTTPVGPIRFDLAYNIDADVNEDTWVPFLTIGYAF